MTAKLQREVAAAQFAFMRAVLRQMPDDACTQWARAQLRLGMVELRSLDARLKGGKQ